MFLIFYILSIIWGFYELLVTRIEFSGRNGFFFFFFLISTAFLRTLLLRKYVCMAVAAIRIPGVKEYRREDWVELIPAKYLPADLLSIWGAGDRIVPG